MSGRTLTSEGEGSPLQELRAKNKLLCGDVKRGHCLKDDLYRELNTFHHTQLRRILGISKTQVIDEHVTNKNRAYPELFPNMINMSNRSIA